MLEGILSKLSFTPAAPVRYAMRLGDAEVALNGQVGQGVRITYLGEIRCENCHRFTRKSYGGGYCYPCFKKLARCDLCVVSPTRCHFHLGTCREPEWGEAFCMTRHTVYLANSSGVKVGLTRGEVGMPRWIDQGATQAMAVARTDTRRAAGEVEALLAEHVPDKTDWRVLVTGGVRRASLEAIAARLEGFVKERALQIEGVAWLDPRAEVEISFPVARYSKNAIRLKLADGPDSVIEGRLRGIIGQFLLFDHGAFNVASHTSYRVRFETLGDDVLEPQMDLF